MSQIVIPIPNSVSDVRDRYKNDQYYANLFDGDNLILTISEATKYTPIFEGTETSYIYGTKGIVQSVGQKCYGFELDMRTGREAIYNVLQAYRLVLYADPLNPLDLTLLDYVQDEGSPSGFITRIGRITQLKQKAGIAIRKLNGNTRKLTPGLTLTFKEKSRRFVGQ